MAHLFLYDGVCGLCSKAVQFILPRDHGNRIHFAAQQSDVGGKWLARFGRDASRLDTMYVVVDYEGSSPRLLEKARAALFLGRQLGFPWSWAAALGGIVPTPVLDFFYGRLAQNRYRIFGQSESCMVPPPEHRAKFLDSGVPAAS